MTTPSTPASRANFNNAPIRDISDNELAFVQKYTGETDLEVLKRHVVGIVEECRRQYHTFGCIANILFLEPRIQRHSFYQTFISSQTPQTRTLEVGVCFGTDFRQYILDGVDPRSVTVSDLIDGYWKLGGKLYQDDGCKGKIEGVSGVFGDFGGEDGGEGVMDLEKEGLEGQFDFVVNLLILHCLSYAEGKRFLTRVLQALRPSTGIHFGACGGTTEAREWVHQNVKGTETRWRHSASSLKALMEEIAFVDVMVKEHPFPKRNLAVSMEDETSRILEFRGRRG
ncbi:hypothetical protein HDV00_008756 [Rhizophlyctis rosea]|nr:hypothetical protein HDV00_008756 [Rhizophlyctis rosea]